MRKQYQKQVRLLIQVLPFLSATDQFVLKGGTAIKFFVRDFPRLSVDIDLTYLPVKSRTDSLEGIKKGVEQIALEVEKHIPGVQWKLLNIRKMDSDKHKAATKKLENVLFSI